MAGKGRSGAAAVEPGSQSRVVEAGYVRLLKTGRIVYAASEDVRFSKGDVLLVQSERGMVYARAMTDSTRSTERRGDYLRVARRLHPDEAGAMMARDRSREEEARRVFLREVAKHGLDMRLSQVEVVHGDQRIVFYFTAPGRVDFRGLVRDLAGALKSRIDLRQIGVRDEARCTGGIGPCGLELCCSTFLRDFSTVSIKMAKTQGLVLNPQKVSGLCGRLMCCLGYEHDMYCKMKETFPRPGTEVRTSKGPGKVKQIQIMKGTVKVALEDGELIEVPLDELERAEDAGKAKARKQGGGSRRRGKRGRR